MIPSRTRLDRYLLALIGLAALAAVLAGRPAPTGARPVLTADKAAPDLAGSWKGTWEDTRYGVSGEVTMDITAVAGGYEATGTIDLTEIDPLVGVRSGTATGTLEGDVLTFSFSADMVGNGSGTLNGAAGDGTGTVTSPLSFGDFTFTGTAAEGEISGTFDFTSPTGGEGVVSLTPTVAAETATWSDVKQTWR